MRAGILVVVLGAVLAACGAEDGDDLDQFMRDAGKGMVGKVDPLPEVKLYEPAVFNKDGSLNDPFRPRKAEVAKKGGLQPNLNRPREPLEAFPLESLQLVGVLKRGKQKVALIKTPEDSVQQVRIGNYLGENLGMVVGIHDEAPVEVLLKEIVQDDITGDWVERPASIVQQEQ